MNKTDLTFLEFPAGWGNMKEQPLPESPDNLLEFLNSVPVSEEELLRGRPVTKQFNIPEELMSLK